MNSLLRSLQIGLFSSLAVVLFIFWWVVTLTTEGLVRNHVLEEIEQQAYALDLSVSVSRSQLVQTLQTYVARRTDTQFVLSVGGSAVKGQSPGLEPLAEETSASLPVLSPGQTARLSKTDVNEQAWLMWFGGYANGRDTFTVGIFRDTSYLDGKIELYQWFALCLGIVVLTVPLLLQRLIVRRSVAKLEGIRRDMLRLEHGQVVALSEDVPSEIMPLVVEFNQLLRRFEQRLRQSRNSVGNLAHSLKGPLNLLIRASGSAVIDESQRETIGNNAEHIRRLIESELKRSRLAGRGAVGLRFDIDAELPAMIGLLEQVYSEKKPRVRYEVDKNVSLLHDRQDMLELIGNLLDNAVKWCASQVVVNIRKADGVLIDVEDDGPGCSPETLGRLTGRGVRLDESVAGHGLGLSIVKDIVDTYDGRLTLAPSQSLGGLRASVFLPNRS